MESKKSAGDWWLTILSLATVASLATLTGCQVSVAGQTLPSAYYLHDDVQYFPAGSENKLANETAALKAANAEARAQQRR